ncbi:hypothetical protein ACFFOM_12390 [Microlunatus capsulatus]|uniref:Uncharacterized protein n=1 Tax=Microlunatus capsulatus TaxID=99117 RepID=A0ABS4Z8S8_9ACTN|nr:hypothetical protein [Microlunatus capsulatus]MBP2417457.1 hypothetical protein [Microlunatus capsulatus]
MPPGLRILGITLVTAAAFAAAVVVTGFLACGVSGCSGAGFGPAYAPVQGQIGLVVCGALLVPLAVHLLGGRPHLERVAAELVAGVVGAVLAMALLGLGPDGCPSGQTRARAGAEDFAPGTLTCVGGPGGG